MLDGEHPSERWADLVDRGGLIHISDWLFVTFATIELCVRQHLDSNNPSIVQRGLHKRILSSIEEDNDVQFYWSGLAGNWDEEDSDEILQMLALQYIISRGHSFASAFNEM